MSAGVRDQAHVSIQEVIGRRKSAKTANYLQKACVFDLDGPYQHYRTAGVGSGFRSVNGVALPHCAKKSRQQLAERSWIILRILDTMIEVQISILGLMSTALT